MKTVVGIDNLVEEKLKSYFKHLEGDAPACELYDMVINEVEKPLLRLVLELTGWNRLKAAEMLGINRNTLAKKINQHGLKKPNAKKAA